MRGIIGLQSIPILNKIFTAPTKRNNDSEILISITPHVVRGPKLRESDLTSVYVGTKEIVAVPGSRPPLLGAPEPTPTPTAKPEAAPTTPPVGVAPPPPPVTPPPTPAAGAPPAPGGPMPGAPGNGAPPPPLPPDAPSVSVLFSPPEVSVKAGEAAALSIVVLRVKDLLSVDATLKFDGEAIEVTDILPGSLLTLDGTTVSVQKNIQVGDVHANFTRPAPTAGSGAVLTVQIRGKKPGPNTLTIQTLSLVTPRGVENMTLPGPGRVVVLP
jgi:hypothetical protein